MTRRCLGCMELYGDEFDICPHCGYAVGTKAEEAIHMDPGTLLHDRYIIGRVLGFGGFGVTYIAWDGKLEQKVAVKEYLPSEFSTRMPGQSRVTVFGGDKDSQFRDGLEKFVDEAKRLAKFQNEPGIVKIFDSFTENDTAYIVMEFLDGETLTARLKREKTIPEDEAVAMLLPVMRSMQAVHKEGILHRDIAPDNIFLTRSGEVKLIDFGASRYATTSHSRSLTVIIKPGYSAEEQYRSNGDQGPHTDVYSLSATLYKMMTGKTPPDAMERRAKIESRKKELLERPARINKKISLNRENAILNAMNIRIEDRTPNVQTFIDELLSTAPVKRRHGKLKPLDLYSWPLWLKILLPAVLTVLLAFGVLLLTGVIDFSSPFSDEVLVPEGMVAVPGVEGMDSEEALQLLRDNGLTPVPSGSVESEYVEADKIVLQSPAEGVFIEQNGQVSLTISQGAGVVSSQNGMATVPLLTWMTEEEAVAALKEAGLAQPIVERQYNDTVPAGMVIIQSVEDGIQLEEGSVITIYVSLGAEPKAADTANASSNSQTVKVTFNANGGSVSTGSKTVTVDSAYGTLPTPTRTYYTFSGWYTAASGGTKVTSSTTVSGTSAHTLYAHWTENSLSGWVLASEVPSNAKIVNKKWVYNETQTQQSYNTTISGWTKTGKYGDWVKSGSGTHYYASFPSGFDESNSLYTKYKHSALTASEGTTTKRTVGSSSVYTYIYNHWCRGTYTSGPINRKIEHRSVGEFCTFHAFTSTTNKSYDSDAAAYKFPKASVCKDSHWWNRVTVYKQTYTDYKRPYVYQKITNNKESTSEVKASTTTSNGITTRISNVKCYVQYREQ